MGQPATVNATEDRLVFLRTVPIFGGLEDGELRRVDSYADIRTYPVGATLVQEGDLAKEMFVILRGSVEIRKGEQTLNRLGRGDCVGEMSLIDIQPRSASVV